MTTFKLTKGTTWNKNGKECMQRNYPMYRFETGACQKLRVGKSAIFEIGTIDLQVTGSASNYVLYSTFFRHFTAETLNVTSVSNPSVLLGEYPTHSQG
jgi:hypothetical protein